MKANISLLTNHDRSPLGLEMHCQFPAFAGHLCTGAHIDDLAGYLREKEKERKTKTIMARGYFEIKPDK